MTRPLRPNVVEVLLQHLADSSAKSRHEAEEAIKGLSEGVNYGRFGLRLSEKLDGDIDKKFGGKDRAFLNAVTGGRSDAESLYRAHQRRYNELGFRLDDRVTEFLYGNFDQTAPNMHYLIHRLGAFQTINIDSLGLKVWSPSNPRESGLQLIASGSPEKKRENGKSMRIVDSVSRYLTRLALSESKCPSLPILPFKYVPERNLEEMGSEYKQLVG